MTETKGHCKHGEFILIEGCPQCKAEREAEKYLASGGIIPGPAPEDRDDKPPIPMGEDEVATETALVLRPGEDIEAHGYYIEALKLVVWAEGRVITTVEDIKVATDDLSLISKLKKAMEEKKRGYLDPLKAQAEAIRETYSSLMDPILRADQITRDKILDFNKEQERQRQEAEEIAKLEREAAERRAALTGEPVVAPEVVEVAPEPAKSVSTDMGSTGMVDHWKYEVVDPLLVPREYLMVDTAMLTAIAKRHHDQKQVPGVLFFNEPIIAVRAR